MAEPKTKRSHRSAQPEPPANQPETAGVRVELLGPKIISWPEGRITSEYNEESALALRTSMVELGQQDAVGVVELEDGTYEGSAGYNRCMAAIESGLPDILCVIRSGSHRDVVKANLATSLNQSKANSMDEVEGIAHAWTEEGFSMDELIQLSGKSEGWIEDRIAISEASPAVKECLRLGQIAIGHAIALANVDSHSVQEQALHLQLKNRWTVRELDDHLSGFGEDWEGENNQSSAARPRAAPKPLACNYCKAEFNRGELQAMNVCNGCADQVAVPSELLHAAKDILAGSQAGAPLAERIAALVGEQLPDDDEPQTE